jgi:hypothetical protein
MSSMKKAALVAKPTTGSAFDCCSSAPSTPIAAARASVNKGGPRFAGKTILIIVSAPAWQAAPHIMQAPAWSHLLAAEGYELLHY